MPQDASLEQLYLELLTSQVAGLYDDDDQADVRGLQGRRHRPRRGDHVRPRVHPRAPGPGVRPAQGGRARTPTRATGRWRALALIEGDATLLMSLWAQRYLTPAELGEVAGSADPASEAILARMPAILKDPLLFPYTSGLQLALGAFTKGGFGGVDELFANPPDSTEQVLHPEKFAAREKPVEVAFPDDLAARLGDGWKVSLQDTLGRDAPRDRPPRRRCLRDERRRGRLGRRPRGAPRGTRRREGRRAGHGLGHRGRRRGVRGGARAHRGQAQGPRALARRSCARPRTAWSWSPPSRPTRWAASPTCWASPVVGSWGGGPAQSPARLDQAPTIRATGPCWASERAIRPSLERDPSDPLESRHRSTPTCGVIRAGRACRAQAPGHRRSGSRRPLSGPSATDLTPTRVATAT